MNELIMSLRISGNRLELCENTPGVEPIVLLVCDNPQILRLRWTTAIRNIVPTYFKAKHIASNNGIISYAVKEDVFTRLLGDVRHE